VAALVKMEFHVDSLHSMAAHLLNLSQAVSSFPDLLPMHSLLDKNCGRLAMEQGGAHRKIIDRYKECGFEAFTDRSITVTECGRICMNRRKVNLSTVLAGQLVGVRQVDDQVWQVSFMDYDPGLLRHGQLPRRARR
jgi:hypothetical protein